MTATKLLPTRPAPERIVVSDALRREIARHAAESLRMEGIEVSQEQQLIWEQRGPPRQ